MLHRRRTVFSLTVGVAFLFAAIIIAVGTSATKTLSPTKTSEAASGGKTLLYVANEGLEGINVIDIDSGRLLFTIAIGAKVREVALVQGKWGRFVYASDIEEDNIISIEASTGKVWGTYPSGRGTLSLAPHPSGEYVYVTNAIDRSVTIMDVDDHKELKRRFLHEGTVSLGGEPLYATFTPDSRFWYTDSARRLVGVARIEAQVRAVAPWDVSVELQALAEIPIESSPSHIAATNDGGTLLVSTERGVIVINASTYGIVATIPLEGKPTHIVMSPDGTRFYVADMSSGVYVIDVASYEVVGSVALDGGAYGLAISPSAPRLYVSNPYSGTVTVIDTQSMLPVGSYMVGGTPMGVVLVSTSEAN